MDATLETNHIALLRHRATTSGNTVLLKLPISRGSDSESPLQWKDITVTKFAVDVDKVARFLMTELTARGIPRRSVVTLLFTGSHYRDLVYTIGLGRASYIPQVVPGHLLTHPEVISSLMGKAGSKMMVYDSSFEDLAVDCPYPKIVLNTIETIENRTGNDGDVTQLPSIDDLSSGSSDVCFVYLTSGSTSGSPKVVPLTQTFVSIYHKAHFGGWLSGKRYRNTQDVFLSRGSICGVTQLIHYLGCLYTRSCIIVPSKVRFSTAELRNMVDVCGLNHITTFGTRLALHIQAAKNDPEILRLLQEMRTVSYGGVPISFIDDEWCFQNGIPTMNMYGSTECGVLMTSVRGKPARFLHIVPGLPCRIDPVQSSSGDATQLSTLVLLADSPQIPKPHLLSADGNFHTGDVFEKQPDGSYLFRGRNDDWIKSSDADLIDAKAIEENIYELCGDLVKECIVVGHLRPSPALFVEVHQDDISTVSEDSVKDAIILRMERFNTRQYRQERITDKRLIFVMQRGVLPRTNKENFRRKAIEEKYAEELDAAYTSVYNL